MKDTLSFSYFCLLALHASITFFMLTSSAVA